MKEGIEIVFGKGEVGVNSLVTNDKTLGFMIFTPISEVEIGETIEQKEISELIDSIVAIIEFHRKESIKVVIDGLQSIYDKM